MKTFAILILALLTACASTSNLTKEEREARHPGIMALSAAFGGFSKGFNANRSQSFTCHTYGVTTNCQGN